MIGKVGFVLSYLLGIDLGTSSIKVLIMDYEGIIKTVSSESYPIDIPRQGYAEQDPARWWNATVSAIKKALFLAHANAEEIKCIGLSGQMHGAVLLDKDGKVIRPAIIHLDQRTKSLNEDIYSKITKKEFYKTTFNSLSTGFQLPSLVWLKENEPDSYKNIYKVVSPKDYIRFCLIGKIATEFSDASGTLAFDTAKREWSMPLINKLGLEREIFPDCHESAEIAGEVTDAAAFETGLIKGTPVIFGGADQPMQALGNGAITSGIITSNIGTGGQLYTSIDAPVANPHMNTNLFCNLMPQKWYTMGAILSAGLSLKWFDENVLHLGDFNTLNNEIEKTNNSGIIYLPYLVGERTPHFDPFAKGMFFGLTLSHTRADMAKAVMEGVTFALRDTLEIFELLDIKIDKIIASGGGAKSNVWLQIQADIFGKDVYTVKTQEQAALGAVMTAGIGIGVYKNYEEACEIAVKTNEYIARPIEKNVNKYNKYYGIYKELYLRNKELFLKLSESTAT